MNLFKSSELKKAYKELAIINSLESKFQKMSDIDLQNMTNIFKKRLEEGQSLETIRSEAFAVAREATFRRLKKRPYDVQVLGGLILDYGSVAEMRTGEGKTIASILPVYLNAISGDGVLVSTVNEYLTERDAEETTIVHSWMGLSVGINKKDISVEQKREAYNCDITYSVHSEIGFDYLKDNMVKRIEEKVQRKFNFALIDEVDSILIDEARTPLIVTGGSIGSSAMYEASDNFVKSLSKKDYEIDGESKTIQLIDSGMTKAAKFFGVANIFQIENSEIVHRIQNSLRANYVMAKDSDYIVVKDEILIVDTFTGRVMEGRSFSDGLHQAIQAKEKVEIEPENQTMATITYQNLFRMFLKLSGMTGTGKTEENEFMDIYNMRVIEIPTNLPIKRKDHDDMIYASIKAKYKAIVQDLKERYKKGQPVLVGTEEVSESETISKLLMKAKIPHTVLNAKQNEQEAEIIANAGIEKAITIATNMAGRGTDIKPTPESIKVGGLYVLGTNKSESRRIDNQLKGRSGRQGDVGESRFYLSIEDKLISRFSNQAKLKKMFKNQGELEIKSKSINKAMKTAQIKIEGFNFDSRKNVLQYDDVIRQQRDLIYSQRDIVISQNDLQFIISKMISSVVKDIINDNSFKSVRNKDNSINEEKLSSVLNSVWFTINGAKLTPEMFIGKTEGEMTQIIDKELQEAYLELRNNTIENISEEEMHNLEREIVIVTFDENWQMHIDKMSKLKTSSSMASYAQKNPYQVYVEKGAEFFGELLKRISHNTVKLITLNEYGRKEEKNDEEIENELKDDKEIE